MQSLTRGRVWCRTLCRSEKGGRMSVAHAVRIWSSFEVPHLRAVRFPGEGSEDVSKHPTLLGILHLVAVEVV